jgi:hypothetical protein
MLKLTNPPAGIGDATGVLVGVGDGVAVGVDCKTLNKTLFPEQPTVAEGVGVSPNPVNVKSTSSQSILGDGVGTGSQSQSKYATKSIVHADGDGVGVGHGPELKKFADISGQLEYKGVAPCNIQAPPKVSERHQ